MCEFNWVQPLSFIAAITAIWYIGSKIIKYFDNKNELKHKLMERERIEAILDELKFCTNAARKERLLNEVRRYNFKNFNNGQCIDPTGMHECKFCSVEDCPYCGLNYKAYEMDYVGTDKTYFYTTRYRYD